MAAANGDRDQVLQKSKDLKFLTGFETKVRSHWGSRVWNLLWEGWGGHGGCSALLGDSGE